MPRPALQRLTPADPHWPGDITARLGPDAPAQLTLLGSRALLAARPRIAFLCSRACPAAAVLPALEALQAHRDRGDAVVSGFHSPLEREALRLLLRGRSPILIIAARALDRYTPPPAWREALDEGRLLLLSPFTAEDHATVRDPRTARLRNRIVLALADERLIPHATPGASLEEILRSFDATRAPTLNAP